MYSPSKNPQTRPSKNSPLFHILFGFRCARVLSPVQGMGRHRSMSRSYSPRRRSRTPTHARKRYDDEPRDRHRSHRRRSPLPSGLLIRNLPLDARPEDLRVPFERYGPVKDVYLPKNYYTGEPRGFGFVKFRYGEDAAEAKQRMNHQAIGGREIRIVFAEENRKTPQEMRLTACVSSRDRGSRRTPPRSPRRRHRCHCQMLINKYNIIEPMSQFIWIRVLYFCSETLERCRDQRGRDYHRSPRRSRSISQDRAVRDDYRSPSRSRSKSRDRGAKDDHRSPRRSKSVSQSLFPHYPHGDREYRTNHRSPSPRENGQGLHDDRDRRSKSPRRVSCSPSRPVQDP
ncbi:Serine/arginine-rich SC35-like splicing factor SCL33 [Hibiscus syriacus]|uniref:Serine/arginine-rich SC35-like splicing factor SCL33 n=1 Tax=Hibiscus syriacus TaxID=106335 RepID=A0A6A2XZ66_HIBSY|nr:Serine/arginine-rich SC35-like splicing factor SCL33 [Hibiscus syriacus]